MTSPVAPGEILDGKYRVENVIGSGGMGVVVAAKHLELGQLVAMKFLTAEGLSAPEVGVRFIREARAVARLRSEHVARVIDVGRLPSGSPYIVMEYLEGSDLDDVLRRGPLAIGDATDYVIQACDAMAEAHRLGIIHRDLKPANLFLTRALDGNPVIKVLDFGISKSVIDTGSGALTSAGTLIGSPLYMSPEQMRSAHHVDARTDIWSLGAVLFELLTGGPPFSGDSIPSLIAAILTSPPGPLAALRPDLPEALVEAVLCCLEKEPERRFRDVSELVRALLPFAPQRAQPSADRVHRIVGSVPPLPRSSSAPPPSISSAPLRPEHGAPTPARQDGAPSSPEPISLPPPSGSASFAGARTEVGQATAPGWAGAEGAPKSGRAVSWALAAALVALTATVGAFAVLSSRGPHSPTLETTPSGPRPAVNVATSEPALAPPNVVAAPVSSATAVAVTATVTPPPAVETPLSNRTRKKPSAPAASIEKPTNEAREPFRASGLSMKLK